MTIKALVFDFDGTIIDTEVPDYESWQELFQAHGTSLSLDEWAACVGGGNGQPALGAVQMILIPTTF